MIYLICHFRHDRNERGFAYFWCEVHREMIATEIGAPIPRLCYAGQDWVEMQESERAQMPNAPTDADHAEP